MEKFVDKRTIKIKEGERAGGSRSPLQLVPGRGLLAGVGWQHAAASAVLLLLLLGLVAPADRGAPYYGQLARTVQLLSTEVSCAKSNAGTAKEELEALRKSVYGADSRANFKSVDSSFDSLEVPRRKNLRREITLMTYIYDLPEEQAIAKSDKR